MGTQKFTQFGTFSVLVMLPLLIFFIVLFALSGFDGIPELIIFGFIILVLLFCLLLFFKLTIYINESYVSFKLGIGLIQKKYPLSEIDSCIPVRNPVLYGIGIRLTPDGWLYNVSGSYAIKLTFKNKKSKIRIGTDKPEEIARIINEQLKRETSLGELEKTTRSGSVALWITLCIVFIFLICMIIYGDRDPGIDLSGPGIRIMGMYGLTINYHDIKSIDTLSTLPRIRRRTNGYAFGKTLKGNFKLYDESKVKLFIKKESPPYILIRTITTDIYLNFKNPALTLDVFKRLQAR